MEENAVTTKDAKPQGLTRRDLGRKGAAIGATLAIPSLAMPSIARAQAPGWPKSGTIRLVVPYPPAGATDIIGRLVADRLSAIWGNQVIVENKAGAGGNIGSDFVAKSPPDGNTMLIVSVGLATNTYLYKSVPFDPFKDFTPVSLLVRLPNLLVVPNSHPAQNIAEFVAYAKANPGKMSYASSGIGTTIHFSAELFNKMTGAKMTHVPYKGSGPAKTDLIGGRVDCMFDNITSIVQHAKEGQVRALGVTSLQRSPIFPDYPPISDALPGFDVSSWFGLFLPGNAPKEVVARLNADAKAAMADETVKQKLAQLGTEIVASSPEELAALLKSEDTKWGPIIKELGISAS